MFDNDACRYAYDFQVKYFYLKRLSIGCIQEKNDDCNRKLVIKIKN